MEITACGFNSSTLGDRKIEACMVGVLRTTSWPGKVEAVAAVDAAPVSRTFFAQPAPVVPQPDPGPESGIRRIQPRVGVRIPRIFMIPLNPLVAAAVVFGIIYFWSETDAPAWVDELNPITGEPYASLEEYEEVHRLSLQEILAAQQAHIKATQPQAPPAAAPTPTPQPQPQPAQPDIAATSLRPAGSSPCPPCPKPPPNASRRDTDHKHWPCKGDHTHYYRYEYNQNPKTCQCFLKEIETHVECH